GSGRKKSRKISKEENSEEDKTKSRYQTLIQNGTEKMRILTQSHRAEQCREASRRYRKRKKALVDVMEQVGDSGYQDKYLLMLRKRMEELMEEKQRLLRDKESAMALVRQLRDENVSLKQKHSEESKQVNLYQLIASTYHVLSQVEAERVTVIRELD